MRDNSAGLIDVREVEFYGDAPMSKNKIESYDSFIVSTFAWVMQTRIFKAQNHLYERPLPNLTRSRHMWLCHTCSIVLSHSHFSTFFCVLLLPNPLSLFYARSPSCLAFYFALNYNVVSTTIALVMLYIHSTKKCQGAPKKHRRIAPSVQGRGAF